jgi:hypothetical protein
VVSSADDTLSLEDESGRVELTRPAGASYASLPVGSLVTGIVMAAKGVVLADGSLQVHDFCFPQMQLPAAPGPAAGPSGIVMLVSGLNYGCELGLVCIARAETRPCAGVCECCAHADAVL